jgi:hypothetical protein
MIFVDLYIITGSVLVTLNAGDIKHHVPDPMSIASILVTAITWGLTWPWWVFKR